MTRCSAPNCGSTQRKNFKFHRFPTNETQRQKWINNVGRTNWYPNESSKLCQKHFEETQYESHRADGLRKLKPFAVPTLFDLPKKSPPKIHFVDEEPLRGHYEGSLISDCVQLNEKQPRYSIQNTNDNEGKVFEGKHINDLKNEIKFLRAENETLRRENKLLKKKSGIKLTTPKDTMIKSNHEIIKMEHSTDSYDILRDAGYPKPVYCLEQISDL